MKAMNLSEWAVKHRSLVLYFILSSAVAGLMAYQSMGRAEDPSFTLKVMVVNAYWPGADAEEMQRQVADKIEKKLQEVPYFDKVMTYCRPGEAFMQVILKDTTPPKKVDHCWYLIRKKIGDIRGNLPQGVVGPFFNDEYSDVYGNVYALTADAGFSQAELKKYAEEIRQRLLHVEQVDKVTIGGDQQEKVFVEVSHRKLATLGISPNQIFDALQKQNTVASAGSVETQSERVQIRVEGSFGAVDRIREMPIEAGGKLLRLGDIAEIRRGYEDPPSYIIRHNGRQSIQLQVSMAENGNILRLGDSLREEVQNCLNDLPHGVHLDLVSDQSKVVHESIGEFTKSFAEALAIVLVVSFLTLGLRTGIVVALSVPLVLAISLTIMKATGWNLDRITLGSLIVALGLLVDDAIIAVEMMLVKMEQGWDRMKAASFAWTSTAFPMLTGTLVTAAGFLPVGFAPSSAGEYAGGFFWIVGLALLVSWVVAVVFTPYLGYMLLPDFSKRKSHNAHHDLYSGRFYRLLRWLIDKCVRFRFLVILGTGALFVAGVAGFTQVEQQFFPTSERTEVTVDLRLKEGSSFEATLNLVKILEAELQPELGQKILYFDTYTGAGSPRFLLTLNPDLPNPNFAKVVIQTPDIAARELILTRLRKIFNEDERFSIAWCRAQRLELGPPVGFPVQFRVVGVDAKKVREIAYEVRELMRENPNVRDPNLEWNEMTKRVNLKIDQDRLRAMGLSPFDVSSALQTMLSGYAVTQYREGIELIDVVVRAVPTERLNLDGLKDINLTNRQGSPVPLSQIATLEYSHEEPILWRRNRDMNITVRGDVLDGLQAPDVTMQVWPEIQKRIIPKLPPGYRIEIGGSVEESAKANDALISIFPAMLLAMLTLLMIQLQSFQRVMLVFMTAPLGIIGVAIFLLAFHQPFGFVATLGVIALAGMIMRNSIILVDQIDQDIEHGIEPWEAIVGSTVRRARPVVLTALAAILSMIPLSRNAFWGPMAIAIMGGLLIATVLTLVFLPALYAAWFRVKRVKKNSPSQNKHPETVDLAVETVREVVFSKAPLAST
ncbi:efflux RND transporter permease subunit [Telmatocola sphagniphila]|uniref:Efflux RND transporter permease subunit n=1 Tax=Telmatocola sphagniphila TaxID=1123043 RepID=A0A8E6B2W2_9BACT|nr:efflux RND transporter permease subunit [Telmatocola sphagniphila]QVL31155.1 efflux RND transporter permease subunit [Telmatocola sphagniphila]